MESIIKYKVKHFSIFSPDKREKEINDFLSEHESIAVDGATVWLLYEEY